MDNSIKESLKIDAGAKWRIRNFLGESGMNAHRKAQLVGLINFHIEVENHGPETLDKIMNVASGEGPEFDPVHRKRGVDPSAVGQRMATILEVLDLRHLAQRTGLDHISWDREDAAYLSAIRKKAEMKMAIETQPF